MVWAGSPFAQLIEFSTGLPTGAVSFTLIGNNGAVLVDDTVAPEAGSLSHLLVIPAEHNSCAQPLFENRTLIYSYLTATGIVSDRISYRVLKPLPFAASPEGVRSKLGIEAHELKDEEIDLVSAYAELLTYGDPTPYEASGDRGTLLVTHAIEAIAGLLALPSLQLKIAAQETSATSEFRRYGTIDWTRIEIDLAAHALRARALLDPTYDAAGANVISFTKVTPAPDVITGA